jgi:protein-L-isoaspartate(D-aspartate) O-methyltransferase
VPEPAASAATGVPGGDGGGSGQGSAGGEAAERRRALVAELRRRGHLRDDRVATAFAAVPRELFVADHARRHGLAAVYQDEAIVTRRDPATGEPTSSSSQPAIMARMLEMLDPAPGARVLEIGAGTGYNAALLAHLVGDHGAVTSVELARSVAAGARRALLAAGSPARVVVGDGRRGWADAAPVDAVIATASTETIARPWFDQLRSGGRLVVPLRLSPVVFGLQAVVAVRKVRHGFDPVAVTPGGFMALRDPDPAVPAAAADGVTADEEADRDRRPLVHLAGPALAGLGAAARRRLLVTALGFGRGGPLDLGDAPASALLAYATLALPEERLVAVTRPDDRARSRQALGVVDADGSLALLVVDAAGARWQAHGGRGAEAAVRSAADRWVRAGRPGVGDLAVTVRYGAERPHAWRSVRRGDQWVALDWVDTSEGRT